MHAVVARVNIHDFERGVAALRGGARAPGQAGARRDRRLLAAIAERRRHVRDPARVRGRRAEPRPAHRGRGAAHGRGQLDGVDVHEVVAHL